jgi:hypothetical protein
MKPVVLGLLRLARPANLPTAAADILAGVAIAGIFDNAEVSTGSLGVKVLLLVASSVFLYAGGVVLNDVLDLETDRLERPERPLPTGIVQVRLAAWFAVSLLLLGIVLAHLVTTLSGLIATILAISIVLYDAWFKKFTFLGPLNMGLCRGLNLCLGLSLFGSESYWWLGLIPVGYIFAITLISRGEVHGRNKNHILWAAVLYALVIFSVVGVWLAYGRKFPLFMLFLGFFALRVYKPLITAYRINSAQHIKNAVMAGVLSLIILDASLASVFAPWWYGVLILLLWPLSKLLSGIFAVT